MKKIFLVLAAMLFMQTPSKAITVISEPFDDSLFSISLNRGYPHNRYYYCSARFYGTSFYDLYCPYSRHYTIYTYHHFPKHHFYKAPPIHYNKGFHNVHRVKHSYNRPNKIHYNISRPHKPTHRPAKKSNRR